MNKIDLTGQMFGYVEVLGPAPSKGGHANWKVKCHLCGKIYFSLATNLKRRVKVKSCGCYAKTQIKQIRCDTTLELLGKRFGHLVVIEKTDMRDSGGRVKWRCRCDCGAETFVSSGTLMSAGETKACSSSCFYNSKRRDDISNGSRFGKLVVLGVAKRPGPTAYLCRCDCGKEKIVKKTALIAGQKSCGCMVGVVGALKARTLPDEARRIKNIKKRCSQYMSEGYIKSLICNTTGIDRRLINPQLVAIKKKQVELFRQIKCLRKEIR